MTFDDLQQRWAETQGRYPGYECILVGSDFVGITADGYAVRQDGTRLFVATPAAMALRDMLAAERRAEDAADPVLLGAA